MSNTPRTDAEVRLRSGQEVVLVSVARQLEIELADKEKQLAEARAEMKRLQEWECCMQTQAPYEAAGATWELRHKQDQQQLAEARAEIERLNAERRRDAISGQCALDDLNQQLTDKDKLIEQMKKILTSVRFAIGGAYLLTDFEFKRVMRELEQPVKAAIEAAERLKR